MSLRPVIIGKGENVIAQIPQPSEQISQGGNIVLYTDSESRNTSVKVPKLIGMSVLEATKTALSFNLNIKISGSNLSESGVVSSTQSVPEGTEVSPGTTINVGFIHKDKVT